MRSPLRRDPAGELRSERLALAQPRCSRLGRLPLRRKFRNTSLARRKSDRGKLGDMRGLLRRKLGGVCGLLRRKLGDVCGLLRRKSYQRQAVCD